MAVTEIRFRNEEAFLQKHHDMTVDECERQIRNINYEEIYKPYKTIKDEAGSEKEKFPPINYVFFEEIFTNNRVFTPDELLAAYFTKHRSLFVFDGDFVTYNLHGYSKASLIGRILRTYPSLIRDFHFFLMLIREKCFESVVYSCQYDIQGRDIIIKHDHKEYEVSLFVDTKRSRFYKTIKNFKRHIYGKSEIQVPLDLSAARKCGDFYLYGIDDVDTVKKKVL